MIYLLLISFLLRLVGLNQSLWLDEAIGALVARDMGYLDIALKFTIADNHPPLYYLLLKLWTSLFGLSEISLRMPSVIFGTLISLLTYKITKNKYTAILVATAPLLVYYSQEARMYIMASFFAILSVYFYLNKKFFNFSLSIILMMFTDYVPVFMLPVFIIYSIMAKFEVKKTILSFLPLGLIGLLWLPLFIEQIETGKSLVASLPEWTKLAGGATFKNAILFWNKMILGRISFYPKEVYYGLLIITSLVPIFYLFKAFVKKNTFYWVWFLTPLVLGFLASFAFPVFNYFRFIYVIPAFYILVSQSTKKYAFYALLLTNVLGLGIYYFDSSQHRENWRDAVSFTESKLKDNEIILINYPDAFAPYHWYRQTNNYYPIADSISVDADLTRNKVDRIAPNYNGLYYFNYLEDLTDPERVVRGRINELGYKVLTTYTFNGVGEVEYLVKE